jgi:bacillithiol system protein YtxJ
MGFLESLFGDGGESSEKVLWQSVTEEGQVDEIIISSNQKLQVILKHSTRCGTSFFAKKNLDSIPEEQLGQVDLYIINVIRHRPVSKYLADKLGVRHESPQLFVVKGGQVQWHGSHMSVNERNLLQALG